MGDTNMMTNGTLAAAVAAAAQIAKNGGSFLFHGNDGMHGAQPSALSLLFPNVSRHFAVKHHFMNQALYRNGSEEDDDDREHDDDDDDDDDEEGAERRMARSRERNREHARRTRLRKKAQMEVLQQKVKGLEAESRVLKQSLEECNIASILIGLSSPDEKNSAQEIQSVLQGALAKQDEKYGMVNLVGNKRRRFTSDSFEIRPSQPLRVNIDGQTTLIGGGRTHINWKSGVYSDEKGAQKQLTQDQLESLRRERNRMHAKMTRDRKKSFIATIEKTIEDLESDNQRMRDALLEVTRNHFKQSATSSYSPSSPGSPELCSVVSSDEIPTLHIDEHRTPSKRTRHGFTLIP